MKAMRARGVDEVIAAAAFGEWHRRYRQLRDDLAAARLRHREVVADLTLATHQAEVAQQVGDELVFRAGECDDLAARAAAECSDIENNSFALLSAFEHQREVSTAAWVALGAAEKVVEDGRQLANDVRTKREAKKRGAAAAAVGEVDRLAAELGDLEARIRVDAQAAETLRGRFNEEVAHRDALWREVESTWSAAFRANLARSEYAYQARRVRGQMGHEAEKLASLRSRINALGAERRRLEVELVENDAALAEQLRRGRELFDCVIIDEFMFWPSDEDVRTAYVVPLIDEREHLNIQMTALHVYRVDRARGLDFVEPVVEKGDAGDDPRLADFFHRATRAMV